MNFSNPTLWIILFFGVVLPGLQWAAQELKKKREKAKAAERIRRMKEEALRTGRAPAEEQAATNERVQTQTRIDAAQREAIQRRQEQLRELRRKQMQAQAEARARARQSTGGASRRPQQARAPAPSPRPSGSPTPTPASAERRTPATKPQPRQQQGLRSKQPQTRLDDFDRITRQRQREIAERQAKLQAVAREASERGESTVRPMLTTLRSEHDVTAVDATEATTSGAELLANLSADDWRRGIVMAEILGKPICERSDQRLF